MIVSIGGPARRPVVRIFGCGLKDVGSNPAEGTFFSVSQKIISGGKDQSRVCRPALVDGHR